MTEDEEDDLHVVSTEDIVEIIPRCAKVHVDVSPHVLLVNLSGFFPFEIVSAPLDRCHCVVHDRSEGLGKGLAGGGATVVHVVVAFSGEFFLVERENVAITAYNISDTVTIYETSEAYLMYPRNTIVSLCHIRHEPTERAA